MLIGAHGGEAASKQARRHPQSGCAWRSAYEVGGAWHVGVGSHGAYHGAGMGVLGGSKPEHGSSFDYCNQDNTKQKIQKLVC